MLAWRPQAQDPLMPLTITCPSCRQMCGVAEEHAGMQVRCPRCGGVIAVPAAPPATPVYTAPTYPSPPESSPPPAPTGGYEAMPPPQTPSPPTQPFAFEEPPAAPRAAAPKRSALAGLDDAAQALGLDPISKILIYAGWGCLVFMALSTFLPWMGMLDYNALGISSSIGLMTLLFTLEIGFLIVFAFFLGKNPQFFQAALGLSAWWGVHATLWRFIDLVHLGGAARWGLYLALIFSLGAAGTFIAVLVQRMSQKKRP